MNGPAPTRTPPAPSGLGRVLPVASVVAAVLALVFGALWLIALNSDSVSVASDRDAVLTDARQAVLNLNTLDYHNAQAGLDLWIQSSTGSVRDEFAKNRDAYAQLVTQQKRTTTATISDAAVGELDEPLRRRQGADRGRRHGHPGGAAAERHPPADRGGDDPHRRRLEGQRTGPVADPRQRQRLTRSRLGPRSTDSRLQEVTAMSTARRRPTGSPRKPQVAGRPRTAAGSTGDSEQTAEGGLAVDERTDERTADRAPSATAETSGLDSPRSRTVSRPGARPSDDEPSPAADEPAPTAEPETGAVTDEPETSTDGELPSAPAVRSGESDPDKPESRASGLASRLRRIPLPQAPATRRGTAALLAITILLVAAAGFFAVSWGGCSSPVPRRTRP